jgi:hypothetical protein
MTSSPLSLSQLPDGRFEGPAAFPPPHSTSQLRKRKFERATLAHFCTFEICTVEAEECVESMRNIGAALQKGKPAWL